MNEHDEQTDQPALAESVVAGSKWHHWRAGDSSLTLCGRVVAYTVRYQPKKPMCGRCSYEADRRGWRGA